MTISLETIAILLSIVSFIVTVLGFFASLKFYRDGVALQRAANDALIKVAEKTNTIQAQVGGMFDKTLDAAIGKRNEMTANFEELEKQLTDAKEALLSEMRGQIGEAGAEQQQRIKNTVEEQIQLLKEKVESTRESAVEIASNSVDVGQLSKLTLDVLSTLLRARQPLSIIELKKQLHVYGTNALTLNLRRRLREMIHKGYITSRELDGETKYDISESGLRQIV
jgi:hypothetical protein